MLIKQLIIAVKIDTGKIIDASISHQMQALGNIVIVEILIFACEE